MIIHALSTFTRCWIFTTMYAMENESGKNNNQIQVLILSEHNHSLEFTTSNYSSMPNSQHV
jgi:hypothetical protein